jgi:hypothetical protein
MIHIDDYAIIELIFHAIDIIAITPLLIRRQLSFDIITPLFY